jgi:hypothetical protein
MHDLGYDCCCGKELGEFYFFYACVVDNCVMFVFLIRRLAKQVDREEVFWNKLLKRVMRRFWILSQGYILAFTFRQCETSRGSSSRKLVAFNDSTCLANDRRMTLASVLEFECSRMLLSYPHQWLSTTILHLFPTLILSLHLSSISK